MVEDSQLRKADRLMWLVGQMERSFKVDKHKEARDNLLHQALEGGSQYLEKVKKFKDDPNILKTFVEKATLFLQGHMSRPRYNACLGLLAARLMFW